MQLGDIQYVIEGYSQETKSFEIFGSFKKGKWQNALRLAKKLKDKRNVKKVKVLRMTVTDETII